MYALGVKPDLGRKSVKSSEATKL